MTCLGLQEVGIFRLPGSATRVNELKEAFNEGMLWSAPKPWRHKFVTQCKHVGVCIRAEIQPSQSFKSGATFEVNFSMDLRARKSSSAYALGNFLLLLSH